MKKLMSVVLVVLLCFSVAACGTKGGDGTGTGSNGEIIVNELTMWAGGQWVGSDYENLSSFIDEYNKVKPDGFKINLQNKTDLESSFATSLRNGKQPDIMIWDRFNTPTYSKQDFLMPVEELISRDGVDTTKYHSEAMKEMIYNNHTYGLPLDLDTWGVYVNLDKVAEYNTKNPSTPIPTLEDGTLSPDWTWDNLLDYAKKLKTVCAAGYSSGDQEEHLFKYAVSAGTNIVENSSANFDTAEVRDILNFFKKVKDANVGGNQEKGAFPAGNIGIINNPTYYSSYVKAQAPKLKFQFMPQPKYSVDGVAKESGVNGGMIGGYGIAFPKPIARFMTDAWKAKHQAAWKFTKWWLTNEQNVLKWSEVSGTLPALTTVYDNDLIKNNPTLKSASEFVANYKIRPQVPGYLNLQVNVINTKVKLFLDGSETLDSTISKLNSAGNMELK